MENQIQVKELIKQEYSNCIQNVSHFTKKYCWIQHPQRGRILFNLYPFQEKVNTLYQSDQNKYLIINKCRQLGISTLIASYSLWLMLFHKDKNILIIATKQETAKNMVGKVQFMYENLPSWLKIKAVENNKLSLKLANGSQIKAVSAAGDSGRSEAVSLLVIDEAAFIDEIDTIFPSAQQTLATGGKCIVVSTPFGVGNWFYNTFTGGELGKNGFTSIKLPWYLHPEKDQAWRDEQDIILGKQAAAQENDCDFSTSGDTVILPETIKYYEKEHVRDPIQKTGISEDMWLWSFPDYSRSYMIVADVARGDDKDYSAFHVIDIVNFEQVAEFRSKIGTRDFAKVLIAAGTQWNNALLVVENASIGWDVIQSIVELQYPNIYYSPKSMGDLTPESYISKYDSGSTVPGFTNSNKTRPLIFSKLKESLTEKSFIFHSKRFLDELRTLVWVAGRPQAMKGSNDDLSVCAAIGMYVRDISFRFDEYNKNLSRATVGNISRQMPFNTSQPSLKGNYNPWEMQIGNDKHDLTWLL